jgi:hypothetical protein
MKQPAWRAGSRLASCLSMIIFSCRRSHAIGGDGREKGQPNHPGSKRQRQRQALVAAVTSGCLRLGRGTSRGTGGGKIPVQSAQSVPSGMLSVQVIPSVQESRPLVMRRRPVSTGRVGASMPCRQLSLS